MITNKQVYLKQSQVYQITQFIIDVSFQWFSNFRYER